MNVPSQEMRDNRRGGFILWLVKAIQTIAILFMILNAETALEFRSFSRFPAIIRACFTGSLVGRDASFFRGSLLSASAFAFLPAPSRFGALPSFLFCSFFKLRLIIATSTIDSMKRIITDDYHFSLCYAILRIVEASGFDETNRSCFRWELYLFLEFN